jgi:hypothetical protein
MSVTLYPFRLRHHLTGKWYRARWHATLEEIERRGGEVCGPAATYGQLGSTSNFLQNVQSPLRRGDSLEMHPHWESPPAIDSFERFLARAFLRRYATWCIRSRRFAEAQGAAALHRDLG